MLLFKYDLFTAYGFLQLNLLSFLRKSLSSTFETVELVIERFDVELSAFIVGFNPSNWFIEVENIHNLF